MWKSIRLICWVLCPFVLVGYGASLAGVLGDAPSNMRLQVALLGTIVGMVFHWTTRTFLAFASILHHEAAHLVLAILFFRRP